VGAGYLFDTNILLRLTRRGDPPHTLIQQAVRQLLGHDANLCYCPQNIVELWNVLTRPADRNGFGLTIGETEEEVRLIERHFTLLPDSEQIYPVWRRLVNEYGVHGKQVHDARLVASMRVNSLAHLLTLNGADFHRYSDIITVVHPGELMTSK
jgi:predicted nucleic acid-binding protein